MAKDLILRLCQLNVNFRYTANTALQHPWITKNIDSVIPVTIYELNAQKASVESVRNIARLIFFMGIIYEHSVILRLIRV